MLFIHDIDGPTWLLKLVLSAHHCLRRPSGGPAGGYCRSSADPVACGAPRASAAKDRCTFLACGALFRTNESNPPRVELWSALLFRTNEGVELWSARVAPEYVPGHCRTAGGTSNGRNRAFRQVHGVLARVEIITATAVSSPAAPAVRLAGARTESRPHARIELPRLYGRLPCPPRGRRARCG